MRVVSAAPCWSTAASVLRWHDGQNLHVGLHSQDCNLQLAEHTLTRVGGSGVLWRSETISVPIAR